MAEAWARGDEGAARRFAAAFVASLLGHSLLLVAARGWVVESPPVAPFVVTMLERGGGHGEMPPSSGSGVVDAAAAGSAPAVPAAVMAPPRAPQAASVHRARIPAPAARRVAQARRESAPPRPDAAPHAEVARGENAVSSVDADHAGATIAAAGGAGADGGMGGRSGGATGTGSHGASGEGHGSDGLRAFCASCPAPDYPARARRQGWQGTVDVELAIADDGAVAEARVGRSSGYPALDEVALDVARRSRFAVPAGGDGLRGQLRYRFVLDATAARR